MDPGGDILNKGIPKGNHVGFGEGVVDAFVAGGGGGGGLVGERRGGGEERGGGNKRKKRRKKKRKEKKRKKERKRKKRSTDKFHWLSYPTLDLRVERLFFSNPLLLPPCFESQTNKTFLNFSQTNKRKKKNNKRKKQIKKKRKKNLNP